MPGEVGFCPLGIPVSRWVLAAGCCFRSFVILWAFPSPGCPLLEWPDGPAPSFGLGLRSRPVPGQLRGRNCLGGEKTAGDEVAAVLAAWQSERLMFGLKAMSVFTGSDNGLDLREWWCFLQH